jgi:hypothetical protein
MSVKLTILGDSNVDRYFPVVKAARDDECIQGVNVVRTTNLAQIKDALLPSGGVEARPHVLLAYLTNPVAMYPYTNPHSLIQHCESVFTQIKTFIAEGHGAVPGDLEQVHFLSYQFVSQTF